MATWKDLYDLLTEPSMTAREIVENIDVKPSRLRQLLASKRLRARLDAINEVSIQRADHFLMAGANLAAFRLISLANGDHPATSHKACLSLLEHSPQARRRWDSLDRGLESDRDMLRIRRQERHKAAAMAAGGAAGGADGGASKFPMAPEGHRDCSRNCAAPAADGHGTNAPTDADAQAKIDTTSFREQPRRLPSGSAGDLLALPSCPEGEVWPAAPADGQAANTPAFPASPEPDPERRLPTYGSTIMLGTGVRGRGRTMRNLPVDPEDLRLLAQRGEAWAVCELRKVNRQQKRAAAKAAREARRKEEAAAPAAIR